MKSSLMRRCGLMFSALGLLTMVTSWLALAGFRQRAALARELTQVFTFQLQVKELQLLCSRVPAGGSDPDAVRVISESQALTNAMDELRVDLGPSAHGLAVPTLPRQLESLREGYLQLLTLRQQASNSRQTHQRLLDLVDQRLAGLAPDLIPQVRPKFSTFLLLYSRVVHDSERQGLPEMESLHQEIAALVEEPSILATLQRIMSETREQPLTKAIHHQEQYLDQLIATFTRTAQSTTDTIRQRMVSEQTGMHRLLMALFTAMGVVIILSFLFSRRTLHTFRNGLAQARSNVRSAAATPPPAADNGDELAGFLQTLQLLATTLRQSKRDLSAAHRRFEEISATIPDWLWIIDHKGICTYTRNPLVPEAPERGGGTLVGQPFTQLLAGCLDAANDSPLQTALTKQRPFDSLRDEWRCSDGRSIPFLSWGRPMMGGSGQFEGFMVISRDISEQQRNKAALAKASLASTLLNQVLELALLDITIPELMDRFLELLIDCTWLNSQASAAFFLIDKAKNALVMTAHRGLDLETRRACSVLPLGTCLCGRVARTGKVIFAGSGDDRHEMSYHGMAIHGHYCLPVHTVAGEIIGVVALYLNANSRWDRFDESILVNATTLIGSIIRRRQAEDGIKELNQELERRIDARTLQLTAANRELDAFAYSVSHDLRAPLRAIDGFSQALTEDFGGSLPPEAQEYLERINAGCTRMGALIDDILRLSRLTRGALVWQPVDLSAMAMEIREEIQAEAPQRMVVWTIAPEIHAEADPAMMRAVLTNLLGNAWKYSAKTDEAVIEFGTRDHNHEPLFFVRDNGAGFDMRYSDKLFTAFQRLHSANQFSGNGIGLATVQRIIHRHGGKIWAEAQVDAGATFFFTLGRPEGEKEQVDVSPLDTTTSHGKTDQDPTD